jgi:hypothetical protein
LHRAAATALVAVLTLAVAGSGLAAGQPERPTVVVKVDDGFHWLDAGVGAASVLAVAALVYGAVLLRRTAIRPQPERRPDG